MAPSITDLPRCCPGCGKSYERFRSGETFATAGAALWTADEGCTHVGYATKGDKLAWMHRVKATAWQDHLARCVPPQAQSPGWWGFSDDDSAELATVDCGAWCAELGDLDVGAAPILDWPLAESYCEPWTGERVYCELLRESCLDWAQLIYRLDGDDGYDCVPVYIDPLDGPTERIVGLSMDELINAA